MKKRTNLGGVKNMDKIKVIIENRQKNTKIPTGTRLLLRRCCTAVSKMEKTQGSFEVNIIFVDSEQIKQYNNQFRNINEPTDVLSFPMGDDEGYNVNPETDAEMLGDIVICVEIAQKQAKECNHSFQREMGFLTVHSMLHLLGYDHVSGGIDASKMREKEEHIMNLVGQPRSFQLQIF